LLRHPYADGNGVPSPRAVPPKYAFGLISRRQLKKEVSQFIVARNWHKGQNHSSSLEGESLFDFAAPQVEQPVIAIGALAILIATISQDKPLIESPELKVSIAERLLICREKSERSLIRDGPKVLDPLARHGRFHANTLSQVCERKHCKQPGFASQRLLSLDNP
jgi:hypothetical protein